MCAYFSLSSLLLLFAVVGIAKEDKKSSSVFCFHKKVHLQKNEILLKNKEGKGEDAASILYYSDNRQHMIKYNFISI